MIVVPSSCFLYCVHQLKRSHFDIIREYLMCILLLYLAFYLGVFNLSVKTGSKASFSKYFDFSVK